MAEHPYKKAPDHTFWRRAVASVDPRLVDPVVDFPVKIERDTRVATAGSCFAQHIARYLRDSGYNYYVAEPGNPVLPENIRRENNYGLFSARYGNIYTARQLLQLFERAYFLFHPKEDCWKEADDVFLDPFRPTVQPGGFISELELGVDREQHLAAVRTMFETLEIFVFTLGLTECWVSRIDGAVFPVCPGVQGGEFHPNRYRFVNETVDEIVNEMSMFLMHLARVNPRAQIILTVSPVPLTATGRKDEHVLSATVYSKSVLRVAAETLVSRYPQVSYFPSFEIITGAFSRGAYFGEDLRSVLESGVSHVMGLFMKHASAGWSDSAMPSTKSPPERGAAKEARGKQTTAAQLVEVECDEAALDRDQDR